MFGVEGRSEKYYVTLPCLVKKWLPNLIRARFVQQWSAIESAAIKVTFSANASIRSKAAERDTYLVIDEPVGFQLQSRRSRFESI